jgi:hypothetical protein
LKSKKILYSIDVNQGVCSLSQFLSSVSLSVN